MGREGFEGSLAKVPICREAVAKQEIQESGKWRD